MNNLFEIVAQATRPATQPVNAPWWAALFGPNSIIWLMVIMMLVMFLFSGKSKRNAERQRQEMLNALKKGDRIETIGGVLGTVVEARETEVVVKVDESTNTKMKFMRSAIRRVVEEDRGQTK